MDICIYIYSLPVCGSTAKLRFQYLKHSLYLNSIQKIKCKFNQTANEEMYTSTLKNKTLNKIANMVGSISFWCYIARTEYPSLRVFAQIPIVQQVAALCVYNVCFPKEFLYWHLCIIFVGYILQHLRKQGEKTFKQMQL